MFFEEDKIPNCSETSTTPSPLIYSNTTTSPPCPLPITNTHCPTPKPSTPCPSCIYTSYPVTTTTPCPNTTTTPCPTSTPCPTCPDFPVQQIFFNNLNKCLDSGGCWNWTCPSNQTTSTGTCSQTITSSSDIYGKHTCDVNNNFQKYKIIPRSGNNTQFQILSIANNQCLDTTNDTWGGGKLVIKTTSNNFLISKNPTTITNEPSNL